ncbi:hypothetical protein [Dyella sp.]|uniref:hypothetical protein n=1 Tax=Dyella sp. TaxID=1869338 RepID=UPI002ECFEA4D
MKRSVAWVLTFMAYVIIPSAVYTLGEREAAAQERVHGWACGMPILGLYMLGVFAAGFLSMISVVLAWLAYRKLQCPRPRRRLAELLFMALPFAVGAALVTLLVVTGG